MTDVVDEIRAERRRQIEAEGWSPEHDDEHDDGSLALAAATYAITATEVNERSVSVNVSGLSLGFEKLNLAKLIWPRSWGGWFKPKNRRRDLIRAGALIVAEIERLDRQAARDAAFVTGRR